MKGSSESSDENRHCIGCGKPLAGQDRDRSTCNDCRSPKGKLADLDIAIRASDDTPERIDQWPIIRHYLRKRFGDNHSDVELWERFTDWLSAERGLPPNEYLQIPLDQIKRLLADDAVTADSGSNVQLPEPIRITSENTRRDLLRTPEQLLDAFADAASHYLTRLRVVAFRDAAGDDGSTTVPSSFLPANNIDRLKISGCAKAIFGPKATFYGVGGARLITGDRELNVGFVIYGPSEDETVKRFRELGNKAGVVVHALDLVPGIQGYDAPLVLWVLVVYTTLQGSIWLSKLDSVPESHTLHFNPFLASIETLKRLIAIKQGSSRDDDFIGRLLAGPDNTELTISELAQLEAYLNQPDLLVAFQKEKQITGEPQRTMSLKKLKLIQDFNRNLQGQNAVFSKSGILSVANPEPISKTRNRKSKWADPETIQREAKLVEDWQRAKESGVYKSVFARENQMTQKDFNKLLSRVAKRKSRSDI